MLSAGVAICGKRMLTQSISFETPSSGDVFGGDVLSHAC